MILAQVDAPCIIERDLAVDEVGRRRLHAKESEIQYALLQGIEDLFSIAADEVEVDLRIGACMTRRMASVSPQPK